MSIRPFIVILKLLEKTIAENPPVSKLPLSEDEKAYLYSARAACYDLENEALVYESDQWVKAINQEPFSSILPWIYDTVKNIYEEGLDNVNVCQISQRNEKIIFCLEKSEKHLTLINLVTQESSNISDVVEKWKQDIKDNISIIKRAYPQYILADNSLWMDIEKDPQSNFTLSREEIDVLNACTTEKAFPLFINGRAGSGKSTMLQYLFADYFSRYISYKDSIKYPSVYFTYNSELLQRAKNFVKGLIKCNSAFEKIRSYAQQDADFIGRLEESFKELKVYLLSIVPPSDTVRFDNINYVTFTRFHDLWLEKFKTDRNAMHDYSPDISWHVILTYIQGMDTEGYLDSEDYDELEEKQKTVSREVYQKIYDKVWKWYSEIKQEKKLWDVTRNKQLIDNNIEKINNGISLRYPFMLRQAANSYKELKQNVEANKCEAIAFVFDKKYLEAGAMFIESGWIDEAIKAFWLANCDEGYKNIVNNTLRNPKYQIFYEIASSIISNEKETIVNTIETVATKKAMLYDTFKGDDVFLDYDMRDVLMQAINVIVKKINPLIDINTDKLVLNRIIDIQNQGIIKIETANIAEIAYTLNEHDMAIEYWDKSEIKNKEKYAISKAYCTKYPDNISLLKTIKKYDEIINQYNKNVNTKLSDEQLSVIVESLLINKDHDKALQICPKITSPETYQQIYNISTSLKGDTKYSNIFLILKKMSIIRKDEWNAIMEVNRR